MKVSEAERLEHLDKLRAWFPKGATVYTVLRSVSASGMSRRIGLVSLRPTDRPLHGLDPVTVRHPTYSASKVLGYTLKRDWPADSLLVKGCGSDMGFEVAYNLAHALYGDGYALRHAWL